MWRPPRPLVLTASISVIVVALTVAGFGARPPRTTGERVERIAETIKCPTCAGESVAQSDAPASRDIRADIHRRIEAGESDDAIRQAMATSFGPDILLSPSSSGVVGLVWILPLFAVVVCAIGLGFAFLRWRSRPAIASEADRILVTAAMAEWDGRDL